MHFKISSYESIGAAFWERFKRFGKKTALIEGDRDEERVRYTYEEAADEGARVASLLQDKGFAPGERCAILMSNQSKLLLSAVGIFWAGGVVVPLDSRAAPSEQAALLRHCEPKALVVEWALWEKLRDEIGEGRGSLSIYVTEAPAGEDPSPALRWESKPVGSFRREPRRSDDVAAILYSSGTGGRMKGCMLTHGQYLSQVERFHRHARMRENDRYFSVLPTHHAVDFVFGFLYPLLRGATVVHQRTLRAQYLGSTLRRYRIDVTTFVPLILKEIQKKIQAQLEALPPFKRKIFSGLVRLNRFATPRPRHWLSRRLFKKIHEAFGGRLRLVMTGGTFIDPALVRFFYDVGLFVGIGYGLTEAGTTVSAPVWSRFCDDNVGKLLPDTRVEIRNADADGVGEIWLRSPSVMKGYFKDAELTAEVLVDGWLKTGDVGSLDPDGFLKINGRSKNMIVTDGGKNIHPEDVEMAFEDLPGFKEQCVFAAHYVWPEHSAKEDKLILVVHPQERLSPGELVKELKIRNRALADYKRISGFLIWDRDFPRTTSLKVKREQLAEQIGDVLKKDSVQGFH
ncbi:MAG: AMP-binding protein [bacterium]